MKNLDPLDSRRGELSLAACALLWSTAGLFIGLVDAHPLVIAGGRSFLATILLLPGAASLRRPSPAQWLAGLSYSATMILFVMANKLTGSANAIFLQYAAPIWVALAGFLFLGEGLGRHEVLALGGVLAGMAVLFVPDLGGGHLVGNLVAVASGLTFAAYFVFMRAQKDADPRGSLLIAHGLSFLASLPFWGGFVPSAANLGGIAALGILQVGLSSLLFAYGIRRVPALRAILITSLEPVFNPLWVLLFLGEVPRIHTWWGGGLILAAVLALEILRQGPEAKARQAQADPQEGL